MPSVIALDAMGSDRAPKPEIEGAIHAARSYGVRVLLIGQEAAIKAELERHPSAARLPIELVHDAGRTQVAPGTMTCCAVGPAESLRIDAITGGLSLL